jgi:hypothetical protein
MVSESPLVAVTAAFECLNSKISEGMPAIQQVPSTIQARALVLKERNKGELTLAFVSATRCDGN